MLVLRWPGEVRLWWCCQREGAGRRKREVLDGAGRSWGKGRGRGMGQALAVLLCSFFSAQKGPAAALFWSRCCAEAW